MKTTIELPDGILQEGETLRIALAKDLQPSDVAITWSYGDSSIIDRKRISDMCEASRSVPRIIIVPPFSMQAWIDKSLPLLTTKEELWVFWHPGDDEWYSCANQPIWHKDTWGGTDDFHTVTQMINCTEQPLVASCSLVFKWCLTWRSGTRLLEVKGYDKVAGRGTWAWLWEGGEQ